MAESKVSNYNATLARRIQELFEHYVKPSSVLNIFHKYDTQVLTRRDMENVNAKLNHYGETDAAVLLLERLPSYQDWFHCLLNVLRDPDVKLDHVATKMETIQAKLDSEWAKDKDIDQYETGIEMMQSLHLERKTVDGDEEDTLLKEELDIGDAACENEYELLNDENDDDDDFEVLSPPPTVKAEEEINSESRETGEDSDLERQTLESVVSFGTQTDIELEKKKMNSVGVQCDGHKKHSKPAARNVRKQRPPPMHGPEYDFSAEEVAQQLGNIRGWDAQMDERGIWKTLVPLMQKKQIGHYVLWYWEKKKRPALSVTVDKDVKTVVIHKKPDMKNEGKETSYFIRKDKKFNTLMETVQYHLKHGVENIVDKFQHPVVTGAK